MYAIKVEEVELDIKTEQKDLKIPSDLSNHRQEDLNNWQIRLILWRKRWRTDLKLIKEISTDRTPLLSKHLPNEFRNKYAILQERKAVPGNAAGYCQLQDNV